MVMAKWKNWVFMILPCFLMACGGDGNEPAPPMPDPDPVDPVEQGVLYNGIKLPDVWPPYRSYTSELESGMDPFYLKVKPDVINISAGRQLFVDDFLITSTTLKRSFYYPEYYAGNPILAADKEWEKVGTSGAAFAAPFSDGVWYDEVDNKYKMWYMAGGGTYSATGYVMCYAESSDGINWVKPSLSVVPGTNIIDVGSQRDASVVWLDKQETNASKRYKMFLVAKEDGIWKYHYKTSSDGKLWRAAATSQALADRSTVFKNPFRNVWVFSMRHNVRVNANKLVRARDYSENADPIEGTKKAEALLGSFWFGPWPNEQHHPRYPEIEPAIYNHDAIPYESIMLGLFTVWQGPENDLAATNNELKRNQVMLGYSRDGYNWYREDMNPFLAVNETAGAWNYGNLQSVAGTPLIVGDKLYFYVSGRRLTSSGQEITTTGLATLRRDGFASMKGSGDLVTHTVKFTGEHFFVNASIQGNLKVELLNEDGSVISGFSKNDCISFTGNSTKKKIEWNNNSSLKNLKGKNIKIKFYVDSGELFSFWISPAVTGESQGYTSGGGPGLNASGIDKTN